MKPKIRVLSAKSLKIKSSILLLQVGVSKRTLRFITIPTQWKPCF